MNVAEQRTLSQRASRFTHLRRSPAGAPQRALLPLRKKVSAKPTDEGSTDDYNFIFKSLSVGAARPLIRPATQATFSRKGRRKDLAG
jgi:hypothetical protein